MIPNVSNALTWLKAHPDALDGIKRGIEREALRVTTDGHLAMTGHPDILGKALTHPWITTDFAESLLEFITPVDNNIEHMLAFLTDIHAYVARHLNDERIWPLSMPCFINKEQDIVLAQYGSSNIGRFKTIYREGLKNRYGALMQTIAGVHYNFSLPLSFWQKWAGVKDQESGKAQISAGYLRLIRNYYRFGWVISYLFGASPAICSSFLQGRKTELPFEQKNGMLYLPYATSLRMSDLGYTNKSQSNLAITFNNLSDYVAGLKRVTHTPSEEFVQLGIKVNGRYRQLNDNVLQIENELYAPIRPKRVTLSGEAPSDALLRGGIEYIEVRALDINPFSAIGVNAEQIRFLDLFLIWCALAEAPEMSSDELLCTRNNWNRVILAGRKPGQTIGIGCHDNRQPLNSIGHALFADLQKIAEVIDSVDGSTAYQRVIVKLTRAFDDPSYTYSAQVMENFLEGGIGSYGFALADKYREQLLQQPLQILDEQQLVKAAKQSIEQQSQLELQDTMTFEAYLQHMLKSC